ncbi:MAG: hypothetical protein ABI868_03860 [Acidobacteriota bacterium]
MTQRQTALVLALALVGVCTLSIHADVRSDEKSRVEFAGMIGRVVNIFGGKAAREGVASSTALKGDRLATVHGNTGQIIDLAEEKIYELDMKDKTYKVATFAEMRRALEEARRKAQEESARAEKSTKPAEPVKRDPNQKEVEVDFQLKETGQKKTINGFDTREIVMTITLREKGKTLEQAGGLVLTSDMWMAPKVAGMNEVAEFYQRYARQFAGPMIAGASPQDMAAAVALYPMMTEAIARMNTEKVKMDGTTISSIVTLDAVRSADDAAQDSTRKEDKPSPAAGLGGLIGGLTKKAMQKKSDTNANANEDKQRSTFLTMTNEVLKVTSAVSAADVAIPAGFRQAK